MRFWPAAAAGLAGVSLNELEKQAIVETLAKTKNNREKAAKILGIGVQYSHCEQHIAESSLRAERNNLEIINTCPRAKRRSQ